MPKVSVIMNCLNGEEYLREAIDSVFAQTEPDWELVFLDNASTDQSGAIAQSYGEKVRYIRNQTTVPLGEARIQAMVQASGEYIAFLDADDVWQPEKLADQLTLFEGREQVALTFTDATVYHQYDQTAITVFRSFGHKPPRGRIFGYLLMNQVLCMSTVMVRRTALAAQPEIFDSRFAWAPEYDLFLRLAYEWECDYVDKPHTLYRVHKASTSERLYAQRPVELRLTLEKLLSRYPGIEAEYAAEIEANRKLIAMEQGKAYWREGRVREARQEFAAYPASPAFAAAWVATIFPYEMVIRGWQLWGRIGRKRFSADA